MNIFALYDIFLKYPKICTDSRKAEKGSLFFAIKGENFDGNKFAKQALEKCEYAIIDNKEYAIKDKTIVVEDTIKTLQQLASYHRKRLGFPILAITGTNGKTTTKELIISVLNKKYKVTGTTGNYNNHIGVPLTLLSMTSNDNFGVVEMGASNMGEIDALCKIVLPDFGIITNIGKAHLEGFKSFEGVKEAKSELYHYLLQHNGLAFINADDEVLEDLNPPKEVIFYGTHKFTHCQGKIISNDLFIKVAWLPSDLVDDDEEQVDIEWDSPNRTIQTHLFGSYNLYNVLAAICIGHNFGVDENDIKDAIESYIPTNQRSQLIKTENNNIFADNYNANPTSMSAALKSFENIDAQNKVLILGDMLELGSASLREHSLITSQINTNLFDAIFLVGENFSQCSQNHDNIISFSNTDELHKHLSENKLTNKNILLKASRGIGLEKVIELL